MKILSLFDGIACARVALERAGISVEKYYASEIDKYALQIAQKNYPDIIQVGDITKWQYWDKCRFCKEKTTTSRVYYIDKEFKEYYAGYDLCNNCGRDTKKWINCNDIDLIIGGFPRQDLSISKRNREGLKGKRSGLFWHMVDIVRFIKPKYFMFENVASMPKKDKAIITETLWGIEPVMIDATLVSAQRRRRLFWVGRLEGDKYVKVDVPLPKDRGIYLKDILEDNPDIAPIKSKAIRVGGRGSGINDRHNWDTIRIGYLNKGGQADRIYSIEGKSVCLSANGGGRGAKTGLYAVDEIIRKLTPIECERLQGLPDSYTEGISNTQRYKCLGNAFNVDVVAHILRNLEKTT